jgi:hypothetical protein
MRSLALVGVLLFAVPQDQDVPRRAAPPTDAAPLPPVQEPFRTEIERRDLLQRFAQRTAIEGFYELRSVTRGGRRLTQESHGYLAIGRTHLSLHLILPPDQGGQPIVQSGFMRYRVEGDQLTTISLLGHGSQGGSKVAFDPVGFVEKRGFERRGTSLMIKHGPEDALEFVRIE